MSIVIEKNLKVVMRDGIELATDIYRPSAAEKYPVVMMRLPYNKEQPVLLFLSGDILRIAQAGYAVVVQDCRVTHPRIDCLVAGLNRGCRTGSRKIRR